MIGFKRLGLDYVILVFIAPLLLGVGWSLRDYANDFVSYFIILVQRPFKIGDFVRFDGKITGVVRKITPRSIIIREKNSVNVLLPNSKVVNSEITNWNYTRSFTAFPDIYIAVPFSADPSEVRDIMMRVLDANMDILKNPKPIIRLDDFSSNGYLFMVRGHLSSDNVLNMFDIASDVRFELTKALRDNNVAITGPILIHKEM
jgi:small-conductance mechanosensitive channel